MYKNTIKLLQYIEKCCKFVSFSATETVLNKMANNNYRQRDREQICRPTLEEFKIHLYALDETVSRSCRDGHCRIGQGRTGQCKSGN